MTVFRDWAAQWGDIASVAGFLLSVVGFAITIVGVWRAKSAAEQARQAAVAARESLAHYDAIADLSSATAIMDEIRRLQRNGVWSLLPDRYSELRRRLVAIRESHTQLNDEHRESLQVTIEMVADLERVVERAIATARPPRDSSKLNDVVSARIDELQTISLYLQRTPRLEP